MFDYKVSYCILKITQKKPQNIIFSLCLTTLKLGNAESNLPDKLKV